MKQYTLASGFKISGIGLHTGKQVNVQVLPAPVNHGIKFKRTDLSSKNSQVISADVNLVSETTRGTTLQRGEVCVKTVEHFLSALTGMGIDNALIELDNEELPILDGSVRQIVNAIQKAGYQELDEEREELIIQEPISFKDPDTGSEYTALPAENFEITCLIDFNSPYLGHQYATLTQLDQYAHEIAPCRTFVFLHDLEKLIDLGLIKGGSLDNAIVIADRKVTQEDLDALAAKLDRPSVKLDKEGVLNTTTLHFKNEPSRHKLLDVMGDLALIGRPIRGKITVKKPGHKSNTAFAQILKKVFIGQRKLRGKPIYDPTIDPIFDIKDIKKRIPHRFPFLLVDKIIELSENHVVGIKNVTYDQFFFPGHFPNNPIFPGVLQIEALAQTGGILALSTVSDPENWDTYFIRIDNTRFKNKVVPGDTIILKMELLSPIRRGICQMYGIAYVGNKIVSEGELTAQIIKRQKP